MRGKVLDLDRPYKVRGYTPANEETPAGFDYCLQDGDVFGWSDSNVQYEWLFTASKEDEEKFFDRPASD